MAQFAYRLLKLASGRTVKTGNHNQLHSTVDIGTRTANNSNGHEELVRINGIIFDMDGTLTLPVYDGKQLLQRLPLPSNTEDILNAVWRLEEPEKTRALKIIEQYEQEVGEGLELQPSVVKLLHFISSNNVKMALLTRNTLENVKHFLSFLQAEIDKEAMNMTTASLFSPVSLNPPHVVSLLLGDYCSNDLI